jgi:subtilisin family serine protease
MLFGVSPSIAAEVAPRVLEDTENGRTGRFLVLFRSPGRPFVPPGPATVAGPAKAHEAVETLRNAAQDAQREARNGLVRRRVPHRSYWVANVLAVEGDRILVEELAARPEVLMIESDRAVRVPLETPLPEGSATAAAGAEWNIAKVNAPYLWGLGNSGAGLVYANADTGVQWDHPALKPKYAGWNGSTVDHNYAWWDAIHEDLSGGGTNTCGFDSLVPCDDYAHGTHTMGTGVGDDGAGNQTGMAPGAKWIACRNMEQGVGRPSTYIECLQFFLAPTDLQGGNPDPSKRPHVVGNSYNCPTSEFCTSHSLQAAVEA